VEVARVAPVGIMLEDGYKTLFAFSLDPNISVWEKVVKPMGLDAGDMIDQTTMHNTRFRTSAPRSLITTTPMTAKVGYDPDAYNQVQAIIGREGTITEHLPDGSASTYFGVVKSFIPNDHSEGTSPEADMEIHATHRDPTTGAETGPVFRSAPGT
jgi:hypothetical protein